MLQFLVKKAWQMNHLNSGFLFDSDICVWSLCLCHYAKAGKNGIWNEGIWFQLEAVIALSPIQLSNVCGEIIIIIIIISNRRLDMKRLCVRGRFHNLF